MKRFHLFIAACCVCFLPFTAFAASRGEFLVGPQDNKPAAFRAITASDLPITFDGDTNKFVNGAGLLSTPAGGGGDTIWTNSPTGTASLASGITNAFFNANNLGMFTISGSGNFPSWSSSGFTAPLWVNGNSTMVQIWSNTNNSTSNLGYCTIDASGNLDFGTAQGGDLVFHPGDITCFGPFITSATLTTGDTGSGVAAWKLGNLLSVTGTNVTFQIQIGGTNITVSGHL